MKEQILNLLTMQDVLNKYGISVRQKMFHCPLHGKDKNASAKCYDKSYYCFACNSHGDLIEFVKQYFNLDFQQAMDKLNFDFNLGINPLKKMSKKELLEIQRKYEIERKEKENIKKQHDLKIIKGCNRLKAYKKQLEILGEKLKDLNNPQWLDDMIAYAFLEEKILELDTCIDELIYERRD